MVRVCPFCTFIGSDLLPHCEICGADISDVVPVPAPAPAPVPAPAPAPIPGPVMVLKCPVCTFEGCIIMSKCELCQTDLTHVQPTEATPAREEKELEVKEDDTFHQGTFGLTSMCVIVALQIASHILDGFLGMDSIREIMEAIRPAADPTAHMDMYDWQEPDRLDVQRLHWIPGHGDFVAILSRIAEQRRTVSFAITGLGYCMGLAYVDSTWIYFDSHSIHGKGCVCRRIEMSDVEKLLTELVGYKTEFGPTQIDYAVLTKKG